MDATTTDGATPIPEAAADLWDSSDGAAPDTRSVSVTVGDWTGDSSSRDLPSEADLTRSLTEEAPPRSVEFDGDPTHHATADDAVAAEAAKREADANAAADAKAEADKAEKKSKPLSRRIAEEQGRLREARRSRGDEERLAETVRRTRVEEERRVEALRREVAELETQRQAAAEGKVEGRVATPTERPKWADYDTAGKSFEEYEEAKEAWVLAQTERRLEDVKRTELAQAEARAAAATQQAFAATVQARIDAARETHPDFDDAVEALRDIETEKALFLHDAITLHQQGGEIMYYLAKNVDTVAKPLADATLTHPMFDALQETSKPTELLGYFAAHPEEVERIARLPNYPSALLALGRVLSQVEDAPTGSFLAPSSTTKAVPPPAARVDGSRRVAAARDASSEEPPGGWDTH